jgi:hypothetical protein
MKKANKRNLKVFSIILVVILLAAMLGWCTNGFKDWTLKSIKEKADNIVAVDENGTAIIENQNYPMPKNLIFKPMATTTDSVTATISATVYPATATNKAVDWTCEWEDVSNTSNLSEYVTVVPDSDGSRTATVTCYQAFTGNIVITVTTRESGYTATCIVKYVGMPQEMILSSTISPSLGFYSMGLNTVYEFTISLSNIFGTVGSQFNDFTCSTSGVGSIVVGYLEHTKSTGTDTWIDSSNKTISINSIKDNFISASYSNGKVSITLIKTIESYYASAQSVDGGRKTAYTDKFRSYVDDCYFKVTVTENNSGITKDINIRFNNTVVTSLELSDSEILF